jgi:mono/diheme cytochrome c family protein
VIKIAAALLLIFAFFICLPTAQSDETPGAKIFMAQKCNTCHSIESQQIAKTAKTVPSSMAKNPPPDLSNIGADQTLDWITKFLKKEVMLHDKKHPKSFTGKDEDLKTLAEWLATLKKA